jgi:hypothetical protein
MYDEERSPPGTVGVAGSLVCVAGVASVEGDLSSLQGAVLGRPRSPGTCRKFFLCHLLDVRRKLLTGGVMMLW